MLDLRRCVFASLSPVLCSAQYVCPDSYWRVLQGLLMSGQQRQQRDVGAVIHGLLYNRWSRLTGEGTYANPARRLYTPTFKSKVCWHVVVHISTECVQTRALTSDSLYLVYSGLYSQQRRQSSNSALPHALSSYTVEKRSNNNMTSRALKLAYTQSSNSALPIRWVYIRHTYLHCEGTTQLLWTDRHDAQSHCEYMTQSLQDHMTRWSCGQTANGSSRRSDHLSQFRFVYMVTWSYRQFTTIMWSSWSVADGPCPFGMPACLKNG